VTRPLPRVGLETGPFWTSGADGRLRIQRCTSCRRYAHPPGPICRFCTGELVAEPVSGRGTVFSFTVSYQQFLPSLEVPYVIAVVELEEQEGLQLTSNIVGIAPEDVRIDLPVEVRFEQHGEVFLPQFAPVAT
jgi:uncharacterized OB-fold protein